MHIGYLISELLIGSGLGLLLVALMVEDLTGIDCGVNHGGWE